MAAVPLVLAGFAEGGLARSIEMLSGQAAVFGIGITLAAGLMLVLVVSARPMAVEWFREAGSRGCPE
jgi:hypothetical protein